MKARAAGIVHFGPGAFHRAHQADYVDRLLESDPRWGIAAVSLRSPDTIAALARQQGRYTLAIADAPRPYRILCAHVRCHGPGEEKDVRRSLADPAARIVTSTVTEKGYCLAGDGTLDFDHPDIAHDLASPETPTSLIGWLALGLSDRRDAGARPFTPLCCDNMAGNGGKLGAAVRAFAGRRDPELGRWIAGEARFPDSMVDSITPATDDALRRRVRAATGFDDAIPVAREAYCAWVIEDALPADGPDLAGAGATVTADVAGYELAKLRILNGAHSALAYLGLLRGHATVADAMGDRRLAEFIGAMIGDEVIPLIRARTGLDLDAYAAEIFARFRNPAVGHRLSQIAWDGSQKLPYRLLDSIAEARAADRPFGHLATAAAAWMRFVEVRARAGEPIIDPLADRLACLGLGGSDEALLDNLLALGQVFPPALAADEAFKSALRADLAALKEEMHG
ncbi:MAG TPA: mannitol dehydrogenase family protein [Allosphingosinicella sp.]